MHGDYRRVSYFPALLLLLFIVVVIAFVAAAALAGFAAETFPPIDEQTLETGTALAGVADAGTTRTAHLPTHIRSLASNGYGSKQDR